jgi:hypothetical protein
MPYPRRNYRDPSVTLEGEYKQLERSDIIVFELSLFGLGRLAFIVTVPPEGQTRAPVYVKLRAGKAPTAERNPRRNNRGVAGDEPPVLSPEEIRYSVSG